MVKRATGKPIEPKQITSIKEIEEALTKALRTHPGCDGISDPEDHAIGGAWSRGELGR
jgi:hypothetical protein